MFLANTPQYTYEVWLYANDTRMNDDFQSYKVRSHESLIELLNKRLPIAPRMMRLFDADGSKVYHGDLGAYLATTGAAK